jgi:hypothetical protein
MSNAKSRARCLRETEGQVAAALPSQRRGRELGPLGVRRGGTFEELLCAVPRDGRLRQQRPSQGAPRERRKVYRPGKITGAIW